MSVFGLGTTIGIMPSWTCQFGLEKSLLPPFSSLASKKLAHCTLQVGFMGIAQNICIRRVECSQLPHTLYFFFSSEFSGDRVCWKVDCFYALVCGVCFMNESRKKFSHQNLFRYVIMISFFTSDLVFNIRTHFRFFEIFQITHQYDAVSPKHTCLFPVWQSLGQATRPIPNSILQSPTQKKLLLFPNPLDAAFFITYSLIWLFPWWCYFFWFS